MTGMMSGLDTESLVKAMASRTLSKIRKNQAKTQTLKWQQETYQSVIKQLQEFQSKYLDLTSKDSLRLRGNLQKMSATSSDTSLTAVANSSAIAGTYQVTAASKAKAAKVETQATAGGEKSFSDGNVKLDFSKATNATDGYNVDVTLDGNKKTVHFKGDTNATVARTNFESALQTAFADSYKTGQKFNLATDGTLSFDTSAAPDTVSHIFKVGYNDEAVGLKNDASNVVTPQSTLGEISFNEALDKSVPLYRINVNGKDLEFNNDSSIASIVNAINGADVGAKASYNSVSGRFSIEATESGAGAEVKLSQSSGNLLNSLFNIPESGTGGLAVVNSSVSNKSLEYKTFGGVSGDFAKGVVADIKDGIAAGKDYNFKVKVDDYDLNITLDSSKFSTGNTYTLADIQNEIKTQMESGLVGAGMTSSDAATIMGAIDVKVEDFDSVTFTSSSIGISVADAGANLTKHGTTGVNYTTSKITGSMSPFPTGAPAQKTMTFTNGNPAEDVVITGKAGADITLDDLTASGAFSLTKDGHLVSNLDGFKAADAGAEALMSEYFGGATATLNSSAGKVASVDSSFTGVYTKGANASITVIDPTGAEATYENASDAFEISGVTFNVEAIKELKAGDTPIDVVVKKDNGAVKDLVVQFVEQYNTLVRGINKAVTETRPKSNGAFFDPLTEEQKEEFSDKEIENWENQAKKGLLYNDLTLQQTLSDLSNAMITVGGNGMTVFDLGITLSDDRSGGNVFKIDETKLDEAINKYGDEIADFFTNAETGLATKVNQAVDKMVSTSQTTPGYLTAKAGVPDTRSATTNNIYLQIKEYDELIASLQTKYTNETARYWKKFTALETNLAKLQSQTDALAGLSPVASTAQQQ
jgi:flagellar hook-associated protein 2